ncbi:MAG: sugar ABC transporter permease [Thaumarchaeota archaeon]|nr:sugar ABC transporter permease [Nitrososphaerota archaeon]
MKAKYAFVAPIIFFYLFITIYPFAHMIYISFFEYNLARGGAQKFIGLANYIQMFYDPVAAGSINFTAFITVAGVVIETLLALALALLLLGVRGERFIRLAFLVPMTIPMAVSGMIWRMLYNTTYGPINYFLSFFGVRRISWMGDPFYAPLAILIMDIWQWTPFMFLLLYAGLKNIPPSYLEAAMVDGADEWQLTRYIRLPMIRDLVMIAVILRSIDLLKLFDTVYMVTGGGPGTATYTFSYLIYQVGFITGINLGYASALSVVLLIAIMLLTTVLVKVLNVGRLLTGR